MVKVKNMFVDIVKSNAPEFTKQREYTVRATPERINVNLVERTKRASNIVSNNIPEHPDKEYIETVLIILFIDTGEIVNIIHPGPPNPDLTRPIIVILRKCRFPISALEQIRP